MDKPNAVLALLVAGFACLVLALGSAANAYDNDMWWILATGREIAQNGIPYTNPFAMHEGMGIVVQQWLACLISYGVYNAFGMLGLQLLVLVQSIILTACLYAVCRICARRACGAGEIYLILVALAFSAFAAYCSVRPHLYTMIIFSLIFLIMEAYRRDGKKLVLAALPLLVCLHVNLHAAMAPFDLVIIAAYLIPDVPGLLRKKGLSIKSVSFVYADYARIPILVAVVACAAALLANPYGLDGALYTLHSYGAADYKDYINEMGATTFWTTYGTSAMVMIAVGCAALGRNGLARINAPLSALFVLAIPLSMMHTRNVWLVALFAIPLAAQAFDSLSLWLERPEELRLPAVRIISALCLVAIVCVYVAVDAWPKATEPYEKDDSSVPVAAMDYLDEQVDQQGIDKGSLQIYNSFNSGGYVEWRGYKAFIDPRPELWEPAITGREEHFYQDFVDFAQSRVSAGTLMRKYDFDYLIAYTNSDLADYLTSDQDTYHVVVYGVGYRLWAK